MVLIFFRTRMAFANPVMSTQYVTMHKNYRDFHKLLTTVSFNKMDQWCTRHESMVDVHQLFGNYLISRNSTIPWPPSLIWKCAIFSRGVTLKPNEYHNQPDSIEELKDKIHQAFAKIPVKMLYRTMHNLTKRLQEC